MLQPDVLLASVKTIGPVVHHITNWVTIYDCAAVVKAFGASPVMAHAAEDAPDMTRIASALVLNIGTPDPELLTAMKAAAYRAAERKIPVILDACGAGATTFRDKVCRDLLDTGAITIIKGNATEVARVAGEDVVTKGVDAGDAPAGLTAAAQRLAEERRCTVVVTGREDIVTDGRRTLFVENGHPLMASVVGTGCMAASVIGTFAAVGQDMVLASASGLCCYEIAGELAAADSPGPGTFKALLLDNIHRLDGTVVTRMRKIRG